MGAQSEHDKPIAAARPTEGASGPFIGYASALTGVGQGTTMMEKACALVGLNRLHLLV